MGYDVTDLLENLFGGGPAAAIPGPTTRPEAVDTVADPLAGTPFADWVRRPDCHGRMGWESPGLPEWQRWWARCDFDGLPEVPVGFSIGELLKPAPQDSHGCVSGGLVDTQDLGDNRPIQGQLRGFGGV